MCGQSFEKPAINPSMCIALPCLGREWIVRELEAQGDCGSRSVLESTVSFFAQLSEEEEEEAEAEAEHGGGKGKGKDKDAIARRSLHDDLTKLYCPLLAQDLAESFRTLGADVVQEQLAQLMASLRRSTVSAAENASANALKNEDEDNASSRRRRRRSGSRLETVFRCCVASKLVALGAADANEHFDVHVLPEWMKLSIHYLCDLGLGASRAGWNGMEWNGIE